MTFDLVTFSGVTTSSNSDPEQLRIKSYDTKPGALGHDYLLSAPTAEDLRQWYRALHEARLLESNVVTTNKRDQLGSISKEVSVHRELYFIIYALYRDLMTAQSVNHRLFTYIIIFNITR